MRALLDVNVIIALLDADHVFHNRAHSWWAANGKHGWASCPLTENGVIRIMSNPSYSQQARFTPGDLITRIRHFIGQNSHEFWPDDISFCDGKSFVTEHLHSSRLQTDFYLLALATKHNGRLVTFDQGIPLSAVSNATAENLYVA
jgi:toxin-antitoxin system PIN domain toxin